jgi:hypothetical protein
MFADPSGRKRVHSQTMIRWNASDNRLTVRRLGFLREEAQKSVENC